MCGLGRLGPLASLALLPDYLCHFLLRLRRSLTEQLTYQRSGALVGGEGLPSQRVRTSESDSASLASDHLAVAPAKNNIYVPLIANPGAFDRQVGE